MIQNHTKALRGVGKGGQTFDDVIEALCVCHVVLVFQEVDGFIMVQVAVGLLFFQLMSLLANSWMAITIYSAMSFNFASIVYRFTKIRIIPWMANVFILFLFGRIKRVKCDVLNEIISVYLQI